MTRIWESLSRFFVTVGQVSGFFEYRKTFLGGLSGDTLDSHEALEKWHLHTRFFLTLEFINESL